jgi:hypothetical protein
MESFLLLACGRNLQVIRSAFSPLFNKLGSLTSNDKLIDKDHHNVPRPGVSLNLTFPSSSIGFKH